MNDENGFQSPTVQESAYLDYGQVVREAFQIFWRHKKLWVFGIIAALLGQGEYRFGAGFQSNTSYTTGSAPPPGFYDFFNHPWVVRVLENPLPYLAGGLTLSLLFGFLLSLAGWLPKGALIGMVGQIDQDGETSLGDGWRVGVKRFIHLFLVNFLLGLPQAALSLPGVVVFLWFGVRFLAGISGLFVGDLPDMDAMQVMAETLVPVLVVTFACLIPLLCLAALIGFFLSMLNELAARSCVLEDLGVISSIKRGWQLGRQNPGFTLLNYVVLWVGRGIFGLLAGIPAGLIMIPVSTGLLRGDRGLVVVAGLIGMFLYTLVMQVGVGGVLTALNSTLWTRLYLSFAMEQPREIV